MALSDEDREALHRMLGCCVDCPTNHGYDLSQLDEVAAWVEARIARHVTAALSEAADAIEAKGALVADDQSLGGRLMGPSLLLAYEDAARIVRAAARDGT